MRLRGHFLAYLALSLTCALAKGQQPSSQQDTSSAKSTPSQSDTTEPYVFELIQNKVAFEADGTGYRDLVVRVRIKSESAVREFGLLTYPFAASFETLQLPYVRVRKSDGTIVETPASDVQELDSAVSRQAPMYTDEREKHVAVKSLSVGDTLEVNAHWTIHDAVAAGHFWLDHSFFRDGACLKEILEIDVPRGVPIKLRHPGFDPAVRENGARRVYSFENVNPKKKEESKIPAWERNYKGIPPPDVQVSSFSSWKEVGEWFEGLTKPKAAATPEIRSKAEELTKGKATDQDRMRALYEFVSTRFRYIGIDLGLSRYTPHSAPEVLANRFGDCKDKHTLFAALLQAIGMPSYPVLISSKFRIDPAFPSPSLFDHVLTALPQGESFSFIDTTPEVAPFGLLLRNLRDRQALIVLPSGSARLASTPVDPPGLNYEVFRIDGSIDTEGTFEAKMKLEEGGDGEIALRFAYRATPQNNWQELTQKIVARMGFGGTVSDVSVEQPEDTSQRFWVAFNYKRTDIPEWKTGRITLPAPPIFLPALNEEQKISKDPLPLGSPQELTYETAVKLPKGYTVTVPGQVVRKYDFAEFSATYYLEPEFLHGTFHFKTILHEVPAEDRDKFAKLVKTIEDSESTYIGVSSGGTSGIMSGSGVEPGGPLMFWRNPASAIPQLERALNDDPDNDAMLLQLSALYCDVGRASDAVALLRKALEAHPDAPEHLHLALGKAYLRIPDVEKAMVEFKTGVGDDVEPNDLNDIAYALVEADVHLPEALQYSSRAVAALSDETKDISPEDLDPSDFSHMLQLAANWDTLGWIKFRAGDFTGAEKYLHSAWEIVQSAVIGEHLVEAYEKLGKKDRAATICSMALASYLPSRDPAVRERLSNEMDRLRPPSGTSSRSPGDGSLALSDMRTLQVPFRPKLRTNSASANFLILITNGHKTADAVFQSGAEELRDAAASLATLKYPQSFPDDTAARIIRKAILSCYIYSQSCTLVLVLPTDAAVTVPFQVAAPTN